MKITKSYFERWGPCRLAASSEKASAVVELPIRSWVPTAVRPSIGPHASHSNRVGLGRRLTNQRLGPITPKGSQSPYIREHLSSFIFHLSSFIFHLSSFIFQISDFCSLLGVVQRCDPEIFFLPLERPAISRMFDRFSHEGTTAGPEDLRIPRITFPHVSNFMLTEQFSYNGLPYI